MIRIHLTALAIAGLLVASLTGCAPERPDPTETAIAKPTKPIACNLGAQYDATIGAARARYDTPIDPDYYFERYGDWVANPSCTDFQVLTWQQLRRDAGESDTICRIVYGYDVTGAMVYPAGCVVPVMVVSDAPR